MAKQRQQGAQRQQHGGDGFEAASDCASRKTPALLFHGDCGVDDSNKSLQEIQTPTNDAKSEADINTNIAVDESR